MTGPEAERELERLRDYIVFRADSKNQPITAGEAKVFDALQHSLRLYAASRDALATLREAWSIDSDRRQSIQMLEDLL